MLTFRDYFVSTDSEIETDYKWVSSRPGTTPPLQHDRPNAERYELALVNYELQFLDEYRKRWPGRCWQLNQDPVKRTTKSRDDGKLHTKIKKCHIILADDDIGRALTPEGNSHRPRLPREPGAPQGGHRR